jgi:hypothetical protein
VLGQIDILASDDAVLARNEIRRIRRSRRDRIPLAHRHTGALRRRHPALSGRRRHVRQLEGCRFSGAGRGLLETADHRELAAAIRRIGLTRTPIRAWNVLRGGHCAKGDGGRGKGRCHQSFHHDVLRSDLSGLMNSTCITARQLPAYRPASGV